MVEGGDESGLWEDGDVGGYFEGEVGGGGGEGGDGSEESSVGGEDSEGVVSGVGHDEVASLVDTQSGWAKEGSGRDEDGEGRVG